MKDYMTQTDTAPKGAGARMIRVKQLVTRDAVMVDSVVSHRWDARKGGIHDLVVTDIGVRITWVAGSTFVPWSNIRYVLEF